MSRTWLVKDLESGEVSNWTLTDILHEINRDRSDEWTPYDASDWGEGWDEWCEGYTHTIWLTRGGWASASERENDDE